MMLGDNKRVQAMRERQRASLEKSARNAGVKNVGHKNKLQLARDIDRARKDARNAKARDITDGTKFAKRPEDKRTGIYRPRKRSAAWWKAYKSAILK
jgi:hypothetical protein